MLATTFLLFGLQSPPYAIRQWNRRSTISALSGGAAAAFFGSSDQALADEAAPIITKMDMFQLKASYNGLADALQAWNVEIAQVQLGNEPSSVVAVAGLSDGQLGHFAATGSDAQVASFKKQRDAMLQHLFLARGAARYEKDVSVAMGYADKAKAEAVGALRDLGEIAAAAGVELKRSASAADARKTSAPEDAVVFQPRAAPKVENKLIF